MLDDFAKSTALLQSLLSQVLKETDALKYDQLVAEIWRVLEEREQLRTVLALTKKLDH